MNQSYANFFQGIIDQDRADVVICNLEHEIIYMNPAAVHSYEKWGGDKLVGRSLLDCQPLSEEDMKVLADQAIKMIPERVRYYAPLIGVTYGKITIRNQRTRWGSCSSKGNLNFNCLLMLTPPEVLDSVVVHELCHRKEMNHSKQFYEEVRRVFPEYDRWNGWLKTYGPDLMKRMIS